MQQICWKKNCINMFDITLDNKFYANFIRKSSLCFKKLGYFTNTIFGHQ